MKKYKRYLLSYALLFIISAIFAWYLINHKAQLNKLYEIPGHFIAIIAVLSFLYMLVNAFASKEIAQAFGVRLTFREWFGLSSVTTISNYFLPAKAGVAPRALYMKNKYDFPYSQFVASYLGFYMLSFLLDAGFGILLVYAYYFFTGILYSNLLLFFVIVVFLCTAFMLSWKWLSKIKVRFVMLNDIFAGLNYFRKQKRLLLVLCGLNFLSIFILSARLFFAYKSINAQPDFISMLIIANIVSLSFIVSITPANLGVKEAIITIASTAFGISGVNGALASIVDRGISFLVAAVLGIFFSIILFKARVVKGRKAWEIR